MPEIGTAARTVLVIGIGAGDPEHLTLQAAAAIGRAEVFFEIDKGVHRPGRAARRRCWPATPAPTTGS